MVTVVPRRLVSTDTPSLSACMIAVPRPRVGSSTGSRQRPKSRMWARSPGSGAKSGGGLWEQAAKTDSATGPNNHFRTILLVADLGLAAVGALVAALAAEARARDVVVPLLVLPLYVPLLIGVARATEPFLSNHPGPHGLAKWLGFTAVYDTVFLLVAVAVFDYLLED